MSDDFSRGAKELATDLDKHPTGEEIIARLLEQQVLLQRENAEIRLTLDKFSEGMRLLVDLVESNRIAIEYLNRPQGGIVQ